MQISRKLRMPSSLRQNSTIYFYNLIFFKRNRCHIQDTSAVLASLKVLGKRTEEEDLARTTLFHAKFATKQFVISTLLKRLISRYTFMNLYSNDLPHILETEGIHVRSLREHRYIHSESLIAEELSCSEHYRYAKCRGF